MLTLVGVVWTLIPLAISQTYEDENEIRTNLSTGYNRFVRPSTPTNVTLYYNLRALQDLDITEQQMTLTGWLTAYWYDKRLVWDSSNKHTQLEINWGWRPECVISNSACKARAYQVKDKMKDPVHLYQLYKSKRPSEMLTPESPFFLSIANKYPRQDELWFKRQALGINPIYGVMKTMIKDTGLQTDKRITPYRAIDFTRLGYKNDYTRLRAYYTGLVKWNQLIHSTTSCDVDISNFPFDTQVCVIEAIFWSYSVDEIVVISQFTEVNTDVYLENAEWILDKSVIDSDEVALCCPYSFHPIVTLSFTFTRRRPFYVMNLIFPTLLLSLCMVWTFLLPTESGERLGYSLTILLAYTVQLSITAQLMPTTSKQVPQIARYLLIVLVLCSVVTCNVVLHVKLFYLEQPVYGWMKAIYRKIYPIVFLQCSLKMRNKQSTNTDEVVNINKEMTDLNFRKHDLSDQDVTSNNKEDAGKYDEVTWAKVSSLMDRICFFGYVIAVASVNGSFLYSIS